MRFFDDLGRLVERRWRDLNYDEALFPEIAEQALAEMRAIETLDPFEINRDLHSRTELPRQNDHEFSDLPITLYLGPRFQVDAYFWLDGTTSIHQHGFSGAFQVLRGSSIHSTYGFVEEQEINSHLSTGQVLFREAETLKTGNIVRILPGNQFIHALFHLDRPSITITVRTTQTPRCLPQFSYLKPSFAINPFLKEPLTYKRTRSVRTLLKMAHPEAYSLIREMISSSDFHTTFLVLTTVFEHLVDSARTTRLSSSPDDSENGGSEEWNQFHSLFEQAHRRHGTLVNLLAPVLGEMQRVRDLVELRGFMTGNEHRFFLALLLNVPSVAQALDLIGQRFPEQDPIEKVCDWLSELSRMRLNESPHPNVLGISDFRDDHLAIIRQLLKGRSIEEINGLRARDAVVPDKKSRDLLPQVARDLRGSLLIKSLLFQRASEVQPGALSEIGAAG